MPDLSVYKGDDKSWTLNFKSSNIAIDITGYVVFFTVKQNMTDGDLTDSAALIKKTISNHSDPTHGITVLSITNSDTNIPAGDYFYDIQMKDTSNKITTVMVGKFSIVQDVTRRSS